MNEDPGAPASEAPAPERSPASRPRDHRDVVSGVAEELRDVSSRLQGLKGEAYNWLKGPEYAALMHRLEDAHASVEAATVEARRRVRLNGGR